MLACLELSMMNKNAIIAVLQVVSPRTGPAPPYIDNTYRFSSQGNMIFFRGKHRCSLGKLDKGNEFSRPPTPELGAAAAPLIIDEFLNTSKHRSGLFSNTLQLGFVP